MIQNLPTIALGKLAKVIMGQAPSSKDCNFDSQGTPFVKVGEFGKLRPTIREWTTNPLKMAQATDVLLCVVGATCGKINLGVECAIGRSVAAIRPNTEQLNQYFLYYFMMTLVERLRDGSVGAAQTVISKDMIESVQMPDMSIKEQHRIVAILDQAFEGIAKARANAEQNLKNARALFESHLQSIFANGGMNWEEKNLNQIAENLDNKRVPITKNVRSNGAYPYYGASGIVDYVSEFIFNDDLLLISEDGANLLARTYPIAFSIRGKTWVNNHAHVLRFKEMATQKLVEFYLNSIPLNDFVSGMAQPKLNQKMLNTIPIPLPPLTEQQAIVAKLDELSAETQRLEALYQRKIELLDELKKSLLQQAFAGEL